VVVALQGVLAGARRMILIWLSLALAGFAVLFLVFPRAMAVGFIILGLWLALAAWLDTRNDPPWG
jgi:hypothetical protein